MQEDVEVAVGDDGEAAMCGARACASPTLVVDLDGTLTPSDTLVESIVALLRERPWCLLCLPWWLLAGRAAFKARIAGMSRFSVRSLPWRHDFLSWLMQERTSGRRLVLATAAHAKIARAVAASLGIFDDVLATDEGRNLKGAAKLQAIVQHVGEPFSYAGDSRADIAIWAAAASAVLVGVSSVVAKAVRQSTPVEREFRSPAAGWSTWLRAVRVHQWLKNTLIFVPWLAGASFDRVGLLLPLLAAFVAFSLAASATYLANDIWDLESDRQHARKRLRPFASGALPLGAGIGAAAGLLASGLLVAAAVSLPFAAMVAGYVLLTTAYSGWLKRYVLIDVIALALLYIFRVLAGSVATDIPVTPWLLAFALFTFLSLALVKRCAELSALQREDRSASHGRDYRVSDLVVLWPLGIGASLSSIVVYGLYIGSANAAAQYDQTLILWLVGVGLIYWNARMWIKTARGEMHDDPVVFAARDFGSRFTIIAMMALTFLAHLGFWTK